MKIHTTITLDEELLKKSQELNLNLSGTINKLLRDYCKMPPSEVEKQENMEKELKEKKGRKFTEVKDNFFITHPEANDEDFVKFMDNCSDILRIKCGLDIKTKVSLADENANNNPMP